ncbi:hypothetical protein [Bordetella bronchiseptica]|uniref:hypothetical protein n=1 Tax=Bordetella bronchiseptica TaxID=518 RepID=UPI00052894FE|nr:hypothetical protein [Bordetella bronchiseptica]
MTANSTTEGREDDLIDEFFAIQDDDLGDPPDWVLDDTIDLGESLIDLQQEHEIRRLQQKLTERTELHKIRKVHSWLLFGLTTLWIVVVWIVVVLQGFRGIPQQWGSIFALSDAVIIAFITSTTASVLGLYGIAAYWLFGNGKKKPIPADKR